MLLLLAGIAPTGALAALTGTVDFESLPLGLIPGGSVTFDDVGGTGVSVTFAGLGLTIRNLHIDADAAFPDTKVLSTLDDEAPITVTFTTGFSADSVVITDLITGIYTPEVDFIHGKAFASLDKFAAPIDEATTSSTFLVLTGPGIKMVIYDDTGTGYTLDDFSFVGSFDEVPPAGAPGPASVLLVGLGLLGLGAVARGRQGRQA
jgi:hypothetical protein